VGVLPTVATAGRHVSPPHAEGWPSEKGGSGWSTTHTSGEQGGSLTFQRYEDNSVQVCREEGGGRREEGGGRREEGGGRREEGGGRSSAHNGFTTHQGIVLVLEFPQLALVKRAHPLQLGDNVKGVGDRETGRQGE
jgi:hypothetical protein